MQTYSDLERAYDGPIPAELLTASTFNERKMWERQLAWARDNARGWIKAIRKGKDREYCLSYLRSNLRTYRQAQRELGSMK